MAETRSIFLEILHHSVFPGDEMLISEHITVSFNPNAISAYRESEGTTREEENFV